MEEAIDRTPRHGSELWDPIALNLTLAQRNLLQRFQEWLQNEAPNLLAALQGQLDSGWQQFNSAAEIAKVQKQILSQFKPLTEAAEAVLILRKLVARSCELRLSSMVPPLPVVVRTRPRNPLDENTVDDLERTRAWRWVLSEWLRAPDATTDPVKTLTALVLSAMLNGGLLHKDAITALVRVLDDPKDSIGCFGNKVYVNLSLSWRGTANMENRRWYPDDLSGALLFRFLQHNESSVVVLMGSPKKRASEFRDSELNKRISELLVPALKKSCSLRQHRPRSFAALLQAVTTAAFTELLPVVVRYANREIVSHSVKNHVWARVHGVPAAAAIAMGDLKQPPEGFDRQMELLDNLSESSDLEPTWLHRLRRALAGDDRRVAKKALAELLNTDLESSTGKCMTEFALSLCTSGMARSRGLAVSTVRAYVVTVSKRLGCRLGQQDPASYMQNGTIEMLYSQVLDDLDQSNLNRGLRRSVGRALREFHHFLGAKLGIERTRIQSLDEAGAGLLPVDANLITFDEYEQILEAIDRWPVTVNDDLKLAAKLIIMLAFRCGLRRQEVLKLQVIDFQDRGDAVLLVRPWEMRKLKTKNATRKLPLYALLRPEELEQLRHWKEKRLQHKSGDPRYLFGIPELSIDVVSEDSLMPKLQRAIREVTQDASLRFHSLRHSFASWTFLKLIFSDSYVIPDLFPHLPRTTEALAGAHVFRQKLYGPGFSGSSTRKHAFAVAELLGHSSPDISLEHYIHVLDIILSEQLANSRSMKPDKELVARVSGISLATAYRGSPLPKLYKEHFGRPELPTRVAKGVPATKKFDPLESGFELIFRHEWKHESLQEIAEELGLPQKQAASIAKNGCAIRDMRTERGTKGYRHAMQDWPPNRKEGQSRLRLSWPQRPHIESDKRVAELVAPRIAQLMNDDPSGTREMLRLFVNHSWRNRNGIIFDSPEEPGIARAYLRLLRKICQDDAAIQFTSYDMDADSRWRRKWCRALRVQEDTVLVKPYPSGRRPKSARCLGIQPIFKAAARGVEVNNAGGYHGFRYAMLASAILSL